ncbi:MAG: DUF3311 domain-containing protein [Gemmatimonadaceae bacterium]|jgi:hypothetical protein|nr:DUF3311 domain-containing protein [Gemmatimonadaceae bacterium]
MTDGRGARPWRWLLLAPVCALLSAPFAANRVEPFVLGLPFLLFYTVASAVATALTLALVYWLDLRAEMRETTRTGAA